MQDIRVCIDKKVDPVRGAKNAMHHSDENIPALIIPGIGNTTLDMRLAGVIVSGKKWQQNFEIKIAFMDGDGSVIDRIRRHMQVWLDYINLKFKFVDDPDAHVRVAQRLGQGSWSYLGPDCLLIKDRSEPTMNFGWLEADTPDVEYGRVVPHEVGHMLGLTHEHLSPTAGIPWDKEAVYAKLSGPPNSWSREDIDHNYFNVYSETQTQFSAFDRESIMLYPVPNEFTIGDFAIGWNGQLSAMDKQFVSEQYPKATAPSPPSPIARHRRSVTRVAQQGVTQRTLVTKNGKDFFWAEPLGSE